MSMSFACASHSLDPRAAIAFSSWRVGGIALLFEIVYLVNAIQSVPCTVAIKFDDVKGFHSAKELLP